MKTAHMKKTSCVESICTWVIAYRNEKSRTPRELFVATKYARYYEQITLEDIRDCLEAHPSLIDEWQYFSQDKRWTPAWAFGRSSAGIYQVAYHAAGTGEVGVRILFSDAANACAFFVRMEMEEFRLK